MCAVTAGPLDRAGLARALRDAAQVARGDCGHDLLTVLDILACDHRPDLANLPAQWQLADAVTAVTDPSGVRYTGPARAARRWCRETGLPLCELLLHAAVKAEAGVSG